jgi:hypothetical protein
VIVPDQGEELLPTEAQDETRPFLTSLHDLLTIDPQAVIAVFKIRSDNNSSYPANVRVRNSVWLLELEQPRHKPCSWVSPEIQSGFVRRSESDRAISGTAR